MKKYILKIFLVLFTVPVFAQEQNKVVVNKIIAQIGDEIILKSDIDNDLLQMKYQAGNQALPANIDCESIKQQIILKALALQAQRVDSLTVSDDEVENNFQNRVRYFTSQYGSKDALEKAMGKTVDQWRHEVIPSLKENLLAQKEQTQITQNVNVTPAEVQAYFNTIPKDSLAYYESQYQASQIVMYPVPNQEVVDNLKKQLDDWKKQVEAGKANFAELAKNNSDEPAAKQTFGQMTINREDDKGRLDPDFMKAAFLLREGQISPIVKSQFGYHIIQMVSRVGNEAIVRHIIKIPPVTDVEIKGTISRMDSLHELLSSNKIDFNQAFNLYNEDKNAKFNAGAVIGMANGYPVTPFALDQLQDKDLVNLLPKMKDGEYSDPQVFTDPSTQKVGTRIIYLRSHTLPHRENMQDDYDKIAADALAAKKQKVTEDWITNHMQDFYITIDPSYGHCIELAKWNKNSTDRVQHFSASNVK
ncbi:MAG: peptidylprolyl isomerase [Arachidicoccus sp.]|nr:peptidylprolyl isomerase [Arachidicoccus sp.]